MEVKYKTFIPYEDKKLTMLTLELMNQVYLSSDPLHKNYHPDRFDLDNQLAVTLGFIDSIPVYLSTLYKRDIYLPGIARTMNRVWKHEKLRAPSFGKHIKDSDITSLSVVPMHIPYAIDNNIHTIFISVEGGAERYMKFLSRKLSERTQLEWMSTKAEVLPGFVQDITYCHLDPLLACKASKQQEVFSVI